MKADLSEVAQATTRPGAALTLSALLLLAAVVFSMNVWGYDLWPPDEPRFAEVAREMLGSGDYLVPHINGLPYNEKPPLLFWAIAAVSAPFGDVTAWSARVPSILAALFTVLMTYRLAMQLYGPRAAFWTALVLMTFVRFWWQARAAQTDMLLTAGMTLALLAFWNGHETRRARWWIAFYAGVAVGLLAKGPPALVFPLLLGIVFYWRRRAERRRMHLVWGLLAAVAVLALWWIPARIAAASDTAPAAGLQEDLLRQVVGRLFLGVSKAQPPWYYLEVLPVDLLPWTVFLPWSVYWTWKHRRDGDTMRLLLSWVVPALVFFSISIGKRALYLLPLYPAFAILFAVSVLDLMASDSVRWRRWTAVAWGVLLLILAAAPFALRYTDYKDSWSPWFLPISAAALLFGLDALRRAVAMERRNLHASVAAGFCTLSILIPLIAFPILNEHKSARDFTTPLRALSQGNVAYDLYSVGFSREEYIFYAKHFHTPVLTDLLEVPTDPPLDLRDMGKRQKELKEAMVETLAEVPIASFAAVTVRELEQLRTALDQAMQQAESDPTFVQAFRQSLTEAVESFDHRFGSSAPAFLFVQEEDWRWLLALYPHLAEYPLIGQESVGRRNVLLIANDAGALLLKRQGLSRRPTP